MRNIEVSALDANLKFLPTLDMSIRLVSALIVAVAVNHPMKPTNTNCFSITPVSL